MSYALVIPAVIGLLASIDADTDAPVQATKPRFKVTTERATEKVDVSATNERAVFFLKGTAGINRAQIELTDGKWPDTVVLRLDLRGLESFQASNGMVKLHASVSSYEAKERIRVWKDENERTPLDSKSPYWMKVRMMNNEGKPAESIPLMDGYFEIVLPKAFFEKEPKGITLDWIDFFRK